MSELLVIIFPYNCIQIGLGCNFIICYVYCAKNSPKNVKKRFHVCVNSVILITDDVKIWYEHRTGEQAITREYR